MGRSNFSVILEQLVRDIPGALGAIFLDWEGESVDEFTMIGETELRVLGAHVGILFRLAGNALAESTSSPPLELVLRFVERTVVIQRVTADYFLVALLGPRGDAARARWATRRAAVLLQGEM